MVRHSGAMICGFRTAGRVCALVCLLAWGWGCSVYAIEEIDGGLRLPIAGRQVVVGEAFDLASGEMGASVHDSYLLLSTAQQGSMRLSRDGWDGLVSWGETDYGVVWSREAAVRPGRTEVTFAALVPPIDRGAETRSIRYWFSVPCELLVGSSYKYWYGMHRSGHAPREGVLTGNEPEGEYFLGHIRHIQFTGGPADMLFDFCPAGVWGMFLEDPGTAYKVHMKRLGDQYVFVYPSRDGRFGGKMCVKIVIRDGAPDIESIHVANRVRYQHPFHALRRVHFTDHAPMSGFAILRGAPGFDNDFVGWQLDGYDDAAGLGWLAVQGRLLSPHGDHPLGEMFSGGIAGTGRGVFRVDHPDGRVLVNVLLSGAAGAGAVTCRVNDGIVHRANIAENERQTLMVPAVVRQGKLDIELDGEAWLLSGLVVQMLMTAEEDYLFDRNWWALGQKPWSLPGFGAKQAWRPWPADAFPTYEWPY